MPREVFIAGQVLTAAELNVVSDQSVMVFAGTAARGSAIPSPTEGMVTYLEDADELQVYTTAWGAVGQSAILQVVSTAKTDTFTTTSTSYVDITGLSATITPSATSSTIFVLVSMTFGGTTGATSRFQIVRDSTAVGIGATAGSRVRATSGQRSHADNWIGPAVMNFLDSPSTTSSTTYKIQGSIESGNLQINRSNQDVDGTSFVRAISTITVMEVAG